MENSFRSACGLKLSPAQVAREVLGFMRAVPGFQYRVMVGTDSERLPDGTTDFVTAIVVYRVGNGGRYFWRRVAMGEFYTIRDRIIQEVMVSLDIAKMILEALKSEGKGIESQPDDWEFEIHIDVGTNGQTRSMLQEVVAIVRANNFEAKTKPDSCAASNVADRHVGA